MISTKRNIRDTHSTSDNLLTTTDEIGQVTCCRYNADKRQANKLIYFINKNLRLQPKPLY
jgi:hypothetical protein